MSRRPLGGSGQYPNPCGPLRSTLLILPNRLQVQNPKGLEVHTAAVRSGALFPPQRAGREWARSLIPSDQAVSDPLPSWGILFPLVIFIHMSASLSSQHNLYKSSEVWRTNVQSGIISNSSGSLLLQTSPETRSMLLALDRIYSGIETTTHYYLTEYLCLSYSTNSDYP